MAYELPSKYVIHAVGPIYSVERRKREGSQAELLASCYRTSLELAAEKGGSVAFSCLSTGVYGYPSGEAAVIACKTVRDFLESEHGSRLERVVFCCFLEKDEIQYEECLPYVSLKRPSLVLLVSLVKCHAMIPNLAFIVTTLIY